MTEEEDQKKYMLVASDFHLGQTGSVGYTALENFEELIKERKPSEIWLNGDIIEVQDLIQKGVSAEEVLDEVRKHTERLKETIKLAIKENPDVKIK